MRYVAEHVGAPAVAFWHELTVIRVTKWLRSPATGRFRLMPRGKFVCALGALLSTGMTIISRLWFRGVYKKASGRDDWRFIAVLWRRYHARRIPEIRNENKRAARC